MPGPCRDPIPSSMYCRDCFRTIWNWIIATGGSVIYRDTAMRLLKGLGTVVYLSLGFKALQSYLHDAGGRGVVLRPGQSLVDLYAERAPLYRQYIDVIVSEGQGSPEETVRAVYGKVQDDECPAIITKGLCGR